MAIPLKNRRGEEMASLSERVKWVKKVVRGGKMGKKAIQGGKID